MKNKGFKRVLMFLRTMKMLIPSVWGLSVNIHIHWEIYGLDTQRDAEYVAWILHRANMYMLSQSKAVSNQLQNNKFN